MRLKRTLRWLLLGLGVFLAGAAVWLFTADLGAFKPQIAAFLSEKTGREFAIDGELHIHLGREIEISLSGLRVANPAWAEHPDMVSVTAATARLKLSSLPEMPLVIQSLTVSGLEVNIDKRPADVPKPASSGFVRFVKAMRGLIFLHAELEGLTIGYQARAGEEPLRVEFDRINQVHLPDDMLQLELSGRVKDALFEYRGTVGSSERLLEGRDVKYGGEGRLGNMRFATDGYFDSLAAPRYPTFQVELEGPEFREMTRSIGLQSTIGGPFRISAAAEREGDSLGTKFALQIGDMVIDLVGRSKAFADFTTMDYEISAHGPDLGNFTRLMHAGAWPEEPFTLQGAVHRDAEQLDFEKIRLEVSDTYFDLDGSLTQFPRFDKGRLALNIAGPDVAKFRELIGFRGASEGAFSASLQLETSPDGVQHVRAQAHTDLTTSDIHAELGEGPNFAGSRFEWSGSGPNAGALLDGFGIPGFPQRPFALETVFEVQENGLSFDRGLRVNIDDDQIEIRGFIGSEPLARDTDIQLRATGDDLSDFAHLVGADLPLPAQPYLIEGGLSISDSGFHLDQVEGEVGPNRLAFDGTITRDPGLAGTDFTFTLSGPNLQTLVADTERFRVMPRAFEAKGRLRHLGGVVRLEGFRFNADPFVATAEIEAKLPFDASHAKFQVSASGQDLDFLLPEHPKLQLANEPWTLRLDGRVEAGKWTFEEARFGLADAELALNGVIDQLPDFSETNLEFALRAPTPGSLGIWNGDPLPRRSIDIRSHFSGTDRLFRLDHLTAQMGETDFAGRLIADYSGAIPEIRFEAESRVIDFKEWLAVTEGDEEPAEAPPADGRAIPDFRFPLEQMAKINAVIDINAQELRTRRQILRDVTIDARLQDGALSLDPVRGEGIDGFIEGSLALTPRDQGGADLSLDVGVSGLKLDLRKEHDSDPGSLPLVTVEISVAGQGPGLREVAGGLNGHVYANSSPGVIPNSALAILDKGLIEQVFGVMLPKTEASQTTNLQCFAARLYVQDGLVKAKPGAAIVTDKVQVISNGQVNLRDEKLDLTFQAFPTQAFRANVSEVLINPFVKISGTLAEPKMAFDAPRALIHTGVAVGTGGLSILAKGLWDRLRGTKDPCAKFMEEAEDL